MFNNLDLRPLFREDIAKILLSSYFTIKTTGKSGEFLRGYVSALVGVALAVGINPKQVISDDDLKLLEVRDV